MIPAPLADVHRFDVYGEIMPAPIKLTIKFKASNLEEFVERYGVYVSQGGIFVRTKKPLSVGTVLDFEFKFQDGSSVLKGLGTVVWTREYDPARTNAPPGMGLRYDTLDEGSKDRLGKILTMKGEGHDADVVEEKSPEAITSPGIQEEKTRVANVDILNKLRAVKEEEPESGAEPRSPASDLFDEPLENLKPDLDELMGGSAPASARKAQPSEAKQAHKPTPNAANPTAKPDNFVLEEKGHEGGVQTDWQDEPTPIPSKIHPLIAADEETMTRDSSSRDANPAPDEADGPELSVADEAKEELLATIREAKRREREKESGNGAEADKPSAQPPLPVQAAADDVEDDGIIPSPHKDILAPDKDQSSALIDNALAGITPPKRASAEKEKEIEVAEEPRSGGKGLLIFLIVLLILVATGAVGYWYKFMRPTSKVQEARPETTAPMKNAPVMMVEAMVPQMKTVPVVVPEMKVEPVKDATSVAMKVEPVKDATSVAMKVEPVMEPDMKVVEPVMKDVPVVAPDAATCKETEVSIPVTSVPAGGEVLVNGVNRGKTPVSLCLRKHLGYTVRVNYKDHLPGVEYLNKIKGGEKIHKALKPLPRVIIVQTKPKGAWVFIDGKRFGRSTISAKFDEPKESWTVKVERKGYEPYTRTVTLSDKKWKIQGLTYRYDIYVRLKSL